MNREATVRLKRHKDDLNYKAGPRMNIDDLVEGESSLGTGAWILAIAIVVAAIIMTMIQSHAS